MSTIVLLALLVAAALYTIETAWFKNKVRERVVAALEQTTGGTVEIGAFTYNWRTLTAGFRDVIVHGTESSVASPLFRASSIRIQLRFQSVFKRNIDIASLVITHPDVHIVVASDGSTNIPSPKLGRHDAQQTIQALLNLKVQHFELNQGTLQMDDRRVPLSARGEKLSVVLAYDRRQTRYHVTLVSSDVRVDTPHWPSISLQLNADAELEKDRVVIRRAAFRSNDSVLEASGDIRHFSRPALDFTVLSKTSATDLIHFFRLSELRGGDITLNGAAHYDDSSGFTFAGKTAAKQLVYHSGGATLKDVDFASDVIANRYGASFPDFILTALGIRMNGAAVLRNYRQLQADAQFSGLSLGELTALSLHKPMPWSGIANGPVHLEAILSPHLHDLVLTSKLRIVATGPGISVSGDIDLAYNGASGRVVFGQSHLDLPDTHVSFSGAANDRLQVVADSINLDDIKPLFSLASARPNAAKFPALLANGNAHFEGTIIGSLENPQIAGNVTLVRLRTASQTWNRFHSRISAAANVLELTGATVDSSALHATGSVRVGLSNWALHPAGPLRVNAQWKDADIAKLAAAVTSLRLPIIRGVASGSIDITGSVDDPRGAGQLAIENLDAYGQTLNRLQLNAVFANREIRVNRGRIVSGPASIAFSGSYRHNPGTWRDGDAEMKVDTNGFPLASLGTIRKFEPGLNSDFEAHVETAARITSGTLNLANADGTAVFRRVTLNGVAYGNVTFNATTLNQRLDMDFSGDLRGSRLAGAARVVLGPGDPATVELQLQRLQLSTLNAILHPLNTQSLPVEGVLSGKVSFEGPLQQREKLHGTAEIQQIELTSTLAGQSPHEAQSNDLILHNVAPILFDASNGTASIRSFQLAGKDTSVSVTGSVPYVKQKPLNLNVNGSVDLRLFQLLDPNVQASGESILNASVQGPLLNPAIKGTVELKNGSFLFNNVPNGLTAVNGTLIFDRDRATIRQLTAHTGGGDLSLGGFVTLPVNGPLVYRLEANAQNVRVRYAGGISVTASSQLRLTGTSQSSILSGTATVSRVVLNPNSDLGNILALAAAPVASPANEKDFLTGMQFDVHLESAPNLQLSTELSRDVEADVDLRLRGTAAHPILLGSISANQGDIRAFGAKYSINRGEISFMNPVKVDPVLNLDLETQARGITVDITISGTLGKLNINYRSDPPLQPRDIIALLTVGRAPATTANIPNAQVVNDVSALQSGANTVLGQAISPASNRLSKLFGITNIKIDPMVQGITNTPQARLTVEQNISRQITVTYVTNLSQTSEQIFRLEWAFSPQYSLVALRDDNGEFGIDIQYRKRFK
ncbi:MAG: translocation/assembly module TamB domain-containing protein [Acidobacteriaceae bacterium]|nr:translocation/assembly module TamB domain-containing protein [Acidobacteriaceae bacterium]